MPKSEFVLGAAFILRIKKWLHFMFLYDLQKFMRLSKIEIRAIFYIV